MVGGASGIRHRKSVIHQDSPTEVQRAEFEDYMLLFELMWFHRAGLYGVLS
jgi:hypothetical protein